MSRPVSEERRFGYEFGWQIVEDSFGNRIILLMQEGEFELPPNIYKNLNDKSLSLNVEARKSGSLPARTSKSSYPKMPTGSTLDKSTRSCSCLPKSI
jgi:hypothetical protein